ncbi:CTP:molybdopterin cytidylyltransferase MocA [Octadecabacter temperatus]|uniref:Molybdopterin-guanine dinucleotide biosynthesis protein MobA n=1 Tax=Octadecabacter temperatus TaxID=1458307 RepID=A0A0K0Y542_9RHOB|nr:nucleotidyltransferase family protein [Octadecabacter temperatus]AKS46065.1 molybdopterin-guanine dinucleotide biosynthesis protein MobA [Octadecabacter temperatus]SIO06751.1 CTP:molybdopterin cytidylyltransferase MocA [Octadecabacter temperatus]
MIPILLIAAGKSSRMGDRDKLRELVDGVPLLRLLTDRALQSGPTYVTLPSVDHPRRAILPKEATVVVVSGQMSDSIKAGIAALPADAKGVLIIPADMPDITADDIRKILEAAQTSDEPIIRACTQDGLAGHPIYFAARTFARFETISGDRGAAQLTAELKEQTLFVPLQGDRARLDLDTPEDWAKFHAR